MSSSSGGGLPALVLRNLGDRSYEKRKSAALEIEHIVKDLNALHKHSVHHTQQPTSSSPTSSSGASAASIAATTTGTPPAAATAHISDGIKNIINQLVKDFAYSTQSNHRKGGLIGLAATAIALTDETHYYLDYLLPPVLKCFTDQESRVRYYACEALYNITKVARGGVLSFFNEIFDGLCKLYADVDMDVKSGAQLLDRLIKDVVTESDSFDVDKFIPLLRERIHVKNAFIRQLLIGWITVLDSVPDIDMLEFLPEYLGGLFDMLSDPIKDIRQQAYAALAELLREITQSHHVDLGPMVSILVNQCESGDNFTRLTVLSWMSEFIILGKAKLLPFVADMLSVCLTCISDNEKEIRQKSERTNDSLLRLVESTDVAINLGPILTRVTSTLSHRYVASRMASLKWIYMLLIKYPQQVEVHLPNDLFPSLLKTLQDPDDILVRLDLEVIARVCLHNHHNNNNNTNNNNNSNTTTTTTTNNTLDTTTLKKTTNNNNTNNNVLNYQHFEYVLNHLINILFKHDRRFLETRGSFIIRSLCELLSAENIYRSVSQILKNMSFDQCEYTSLMVQTLNLILLTSSEVADLRLKLKRSLLSVEGRELFMSLYISWTHNCISTFSLCLLTQSYELAAALIVTMADYELTVGMLMQIDKIVGLLESPIFLHIRIDLLEPNRHPFLYKALYGILMLLPQSSAFTSLKTRLDSVAPIQHLNVPHSTMLDDRYRKLHGQTEHTDAHHKTSSSTSPTSNTSNSANADQSNGRPTPHSHDHRLPWSELLWAFEETQRIHYARRLQAFKELSLLTQSEEFTPVVSTSRDGHSRAASLSNIPPLAAVGNGSKSEETSSTTHVNIQLLSTS